MIERLLSAYKALGSIFSTENNNTKKKAFSCDTNARKVFEEIFFKVEPCF